jgi:hypothetical protein
MNINKSEIEVTEVNLTEKTILEYLNSGVTWYRKDDVGYGSIEEKYNANPAQIEMIRKHPSFKGVKTRVTIFNIVSDETTNSTKESKSTRTGNDVEQPVVPVVSQSTKMDAVQSATEAADLFANL